MSLSFTRYIDITSVVGGGAQVPVRNNAGRIMTDNILLPPASFLEASSAQSIGAYFGTESQEYARAQFYFDRVSKTGVRPTLISFARWVDTDTAPYIVGAVKTQSVGLYTGITTGSFTMTIGGVTNNFTSIDFSSALSLSDVASILQTKIRTASGIQWTAATVTFDAVRGCFDFVGGDAVVATISVANYSSGTPILSTLGWLTGAIIGYGTLTESITTTLDNTYNASNNFGSFLFLPNLTLDQDVEAGTWTAGKNVRVMYFPRVSLASALTNAAALSELDGVGLTVSQVEDNFEIDSVTVNTAGSYTVNPILSFIGNGMGGEVQPHLLATIATQSNPGSTYVPGDTITAAGGIYLTQLQLTVATTELDSLTVSAPGTGFAVDDTLTLTGGTFTTAAVIRVDTVDGGGGILTFSVITRGSYTVNPSSGAYTTSGAGTGATLSSLIFGINTVSVSNVGDYTVIPDNPVLQDTTSGSGSGAQFNVTWAVNTVEVLNGGEGYDNTSELLFNGGSPNAAAVLNLAALPPTEFAEQAPMMIFAATDYTATDGVQNYEFQQFNLTPTVIDDDTGDALDAADVNYYGQTQESGVKKSFYQKGVLFGSGDAPQDMNTFANEIWLKSAIEAAIMNLLLSIPALSGNTRGLSQFSAIVQPVLDQGVSNGTISAGNTITPTQQAFITEITGSSSAWQQVQAIGYWFNPQVVPYIDTDNVQRYSINYILVYGKDNAVRLVTGTDVLI